MRVIDEQYIPTPRGGILYDASRLRKPDEEVFTREFWAAQNALEEIRGGRGSVAFLRAEGSQWVLRHYRRGGLIARISEDRYLWLGAVRTRSFSEWRLLAELHRRSLPVPRPLAARYLRAGPSYRADLITERLPASRTLADSITGATLAAGRWRAVGHTIAAFHRHGVHHADLNAHNILLSDGDAAVYLLDFDRGRIRARGSWEERVLERLHRSLEKIKGQRANVQFSEQQWQWLMEGYRESGQRAAGSGQ